MLVYNHLRKSALTPDDLGVGAVCFMVVYHENSEAKERKEKNETDWQCRSTAKSIPCCSEVRLGILQ